MKSGDRQGVSQALIHDFVHRDLPLIERTLEEVKAGETLSWGEVEAMSEQIDQVKSWYSVAGELPEYRSLLARIIETYDQIATLALKNETGRDPGA